jgi:hypothetical protein
MLVIEILDLQLLLEQFAVLFEFGCTRWRDACSAFVLLSGIQASLFHSLQFWMMIARSTFTLMNKVPIATPLIYTLFVIEPSTAMAAGSHYNIN